MTRLGGDALRMCRMLWQSTRGGRVKLASLAAPSSDYNHEQKGDALHAMELTLALEKVRALRMPGFFRAASEEMAGLGAAETHH